MMKIWSSPQISHLGGYAYPSLGSPARLCKTKLCREILYPISPIFEGFGIILKTNVLNMRKQILPPTETKIGVLDFKNQYLW